MTDNFYRKLEDKFRGSRELIKSRQEIYLPFILPLKNIYPEAKAVDVGCGRGEWLELLGENGFDAQGIDLDDKMLAACRELNLTVTQGDAIAFLKAIPENSLTLVSGFHIAEHLPFEVLKELVFEAHRALKPAGLLILETPNPENLTVGTSQFYLDPTHEKPIPPELLAFIPEYYEFKRIKTLRLQERTHLNEIQSISLDDVFQGVSPDYGIVAQKDGPEEILEFNTPSFSGEYGISLGEITKQFDINLKKRFFLNEIENDGKATKNGNPATELNVAHQKWYKVFEDLSSDMSIIRNNLSTAQADNEKLHASVKHLKWVEEKLAQSEDFVHELEDKINTRESYIDHKETEWHYQKMEFQNEIFELHELNQHFDQEIKNVYSSKSWKVSAPLRQMGVVKNSIKKPIKSIFSIPKNIIKWVVFSIISLVRKSVFLNGLTIGLIKKVPALDNRLRQMVRNRLADNSFLDLEDSVNLSASARRVFVDLKTQIEQSQKEKG
ncbi:MAG: class I SAM-dependent methyltransferase [SAR324 cluster bacterium]|nr:class I SAM-dependent methyltransferase [SAR324 cluster bacterium]